MRRKQDAQKKRERKKKEEKTPTKTYVPMELLQITNCTEHFVMVAKLPSHFSVHFVLVAECGLNCLQRSHMKRPAEQDKKGEPRRTWLASPRRQCRVLTLMTAGDFPRFNEGQEQNCVKVETF